MQRRRLFLFRLLLGVVLWSLFIESLYHNRFSPLSLVILAIYTLSLPIPLIEKKIVERIERVGTGLFIFDIGSIILFAYSGGILHSEFYILFFLTVLLSAMARKTIMALATAVVISALYFWLSSSSRTGVQPFSFAFNFHIITFYIAAIFIGYLSEECYHYRERLTHSVRVQTIGQMAAGIAHQFNNILMIISGFSELALKQINDTSKVRDYLEKIKLSILDAMNIVQRFTRFSKPKHSIPVQDISVNEVVKQSLQMTQPRWKDEAEKKSISIQVEADLHEVPSIKGMDPEFREVLVNLILNAIEAMPKGGKLCISTRFVKGKVRIEITDTGIGISPEKQKKLFTPFFSTKAESGTGLGLFICHEIVNNMDGTIRVTSSKAKGSCFILEFPSYIKGKSEVKAMEDESIKQPLNPSSLNIIVVDDEKAICEIFKEFLETAGHKVYTFSKPQAAVQQLRKQPFDLIITDLGMTPLNGWDVLRHAKEVHPNAKTILITGWGKGIIQEDAQSQGADIVLTKPVEFQQLISAVNKLMVF